jgi:hypothetical protein
MKAIAGLLVVAVAAYIGFQFIPPYFTKYQFTDDCQSIARFAGATTTKSEDDIRSEVMTKVKEYNLPIRPEQVKVVRENQQVTISTDYTQVVELVGGKQVPLSFHIQTGK